MPPTTSQSCWRFQAFPFPSNCALWPNSSGLAPSGCVQNSHLEKKLCVESKLPADGMKANNLKGRLETAPPGRVSRPLQLFKRTLRIPSTGKRDAKFNNGA